MTETAGPAGEPLRRTPLYGWHVRAGARMVPFGGWEMPVQYAGVIPEHRAVRTAAGVFDVSHMGEFRLAGPDALAVVNGIITHDAAALDVDQVLYTPMCREHGGIVDDLLVYRLGADRFQVVVNAANRAKDYAWFEAHCAGRRVTLEDVSLETGLIAVQGPRAEAVLGRVAETDLAGIGYYRCRQGVPVAGVPCLVSRTGYTGEDGFEVYCPWDAAPRLWEAILDAGRPEGAVPAGLGARDTLRLEARLLLYGNDIDETTTPLEAGLGWTVKWDKGDFVGRAALERQRAGGVPKKLVGFELVERGIPRHGYPIHKDGTPVGTVTSGTFSPTLDKSVGLGYVPPGLAAVGTALEIIIRERPVRAVVVKTPFYRRPAHPR